MIALNLDDARFDRTAGAATLLEGLGQRLEFIVDERHAVQRGHALALAAAGLAANAHHPVEGGDAFGLGLVGTPAVGKRLAADGAGLAMFGGIDESRVAFCHAWAVAIIDDGGSGALPKI